MSVDRSEIKVVKLLDATTQKLFSEGTLLPTDVLFTAVLPSVPQPQTNDQVLVVFENGDVRQGADYSGSHILYQDIVIPAGQKAQLEKFLTDEPGLPAHDGLWFV